MIDLNLNNLRTFSVLFRKTSTKEYIFLGCTVIMKKLKGIYLIIALVATNYFHAQNLLSDSTFKDGDVIFIKNKKLIGSNLIPNGKTSFNYVGVVLIENGEPIVYHATEPVSSCSINDFLNLSEGRSYKIRRMYEQELLTKDVVATMRSFAKAKLQTHYDNKLTLNNDEFYNAEFVFKMYQACLGIPLTKPKPITAYKPDAVALDFLKESYGAGILTEKLVIIGDIYNSEFLE